LLKLVAYRHNLLAASVLASAALHAPTALGAESLRLDFDIPAGALGASLQVLAAQAHVQLVFSPTSVAGRRAPPLQGRFSAEEALRRLLAGTGMQALHSGPTTIVLKGSGSAQLAPVSTLAATQPSSAVAGGFAAPLADPAPGPQDKAQPTTEEVVVTGSHIRGGGSTGSPIVDLSRDEIRREGDATVADALGHMTQTFNGTSTPISSLSGADRLGTNVSISQGVNLRGLGANATLVLLDGHRLAGTGDLGDFVDVSAIPTSIVERVEVLLDGASAVYGSDAVGGVVNIITRKDFQGLEGDVRFGEDAGGGGAYVQTSATLGQTWSGGHVLFSYEYQHNDRLASAGHPFADNSDQRANGGSNHDLIESTPGNILELNASGTGYIPAYAIPAGDGVGLTPSDFVLGTANASNAYRDTDIAPEMDRNSVFAAYSQDLGPQTRVDLEARYTLRQYTSRSPASAAILEVTPANPYYVAPNGAPYELIGYSADNLVGPTVAAGFTRNFDVSASVSRELGHDWKLEAYAGYAAEYGRASDFNLFNYAALSEALGDTPDDPTTSYSTAKDGFFNPYGDGAQNSALIRHFVAGGWATSVDLSQVTTAGVQADGPLFDLPGGPVKAAFGAQFRHERFESTVYSELSTTSPVAYGDGANARDIAAAFGELHIPIVGASNSVVGINRLEVSAAGRVEHYDDVGTTANPKIGLLWKPFEDVGVRATYSTSFRAPALSEINTAEEVDPYLLGQTLTLVETGGNRGLKPETATSWTAGADWTPRFAPGLHLGVTWFETDFKNQIGQPGETYLTQVLTNPAFASLVTPVNAANPADLAKIQALLAITAPSEAGLYPPSAYADIIDARYLNTASLEVAGLDLNADYRFSWGRELYSISASGSYLYTYSQRQTASSPEESLLNTPSEPVDFRGKVVGDWRHGPLDTALTLNYTDRYKDPATGRRIDSFTTLDLVLAWRSEASSGALKNASVTFTAQNLFDQTPPFYDSPLGLGYDPANASPLGRVISLELNKRW